MRLWTLHPKYLDAKGLVALWREGLLAKAVLAGQTKGYTHHPQLIRFLNHQQPLATVCEYLRSVLTESQHRGYCFNATKLPPESLTVYLIEETRGQLVYEWQHLLKKLSLRDPDRFQQLSAVIRPEPHPLFTIVPGHIREWEKASPQRAQVNL